MKLDELLPGLRSFPVGRYLIFHRVDEDRVEIVRVLSAYRDLDSLF
jgi:toxin ParE1/3/4